MLAQAFEFEALLSGLERRGVIRRAEVLEEIARLKEKTPKGRCAGSTRPAERRVLTFPHQGGIIMALTVTASVRNALRTLEGERKRIDRQIDALRGVLRVFPGGGDTAAPAAPAAPARKRRRMSAAARKAASLRMKAYWAKRREQAAKAKGKGGK